MARLIDKQAANYTRSVGGVSRKERQTGASEDGEDVSYDDELPPADSEEWWDDFHPPDEVRRKLQHIWDSGRYLRRHLGRSPESLLLEPYRIY
jgi:hypothetical protein